jgi:hypothetical protein
MNVPVNKCIGQTMPNIFRLEFLFGTSIKAVGVSVRWVAENYVVELKDRWCDLVEPNGGL